MLLGVGVSHKRTSLSTLDALNIRDQGKFYSDLKAVRGINEAIVLQTCNRVEVFIEGQGLEAETVLRSWALDTKFRLIDLQRTVEIRTGNEVIRHLLRVSSGLESMILGEPQILGQIRESMLTARSLGAGGPVLFDLFERVTAAAARIRSETGVGRGVTTVGSAALRLAEQTLGQLEGLRVLLVGTGQVGLLVMKALKARGVRDIIVAGRNREKTETFCRSYGGHPIEFQQVGEETQNSDLVILATRSTNFLVDKASLNWRTQANGRKLMILDLSNPRNVSPEVGRLEGITLCTIDDLKGIAEEGLSMRKELVKKAEPLIENAVQRITTGLRRETAEPIISDFYHRAEDIRLEEVSKALSKLQLTAEQEEVLEYMSQKIVEKVLNGPVAKLRQAAEKGDSKVLTVGGQLFAEE
ncbi:MAG TPA: glutamyl-tRNA reductase [Candidatus Bathyarchaeia archaeon]|nr:glutamyl-tRNA reductase [Candidatus Bathyarchaeia archaeon]